MADYVICYDITCPRRLSRVYRQLRRQACRVQYSVFLFTGSDTELSKCLEKIESLIDPRYDDVRAYPVPRRGLRFTMGRATLPDGIHWSELSEKRALTALPADTYIISDTSRR